ncbi:unnamed protein product, partial [Prorocentrum cordatum]
RGRRLARLSIGLARAEGAPQAAHCRWAGLACFCAGHRRPPFAISQEIFAAAIEAPRPRGPLEAGKGAGANLRARLGASRLLGRLAARRRGSCGLDAGGGRGCPDCRGGVGHGQLAHRDSREQAGRGGAAALRWALRARGGQGGGRRRRRRASNEPANLALKALRHRLSRNGATAIARQASSWLRGLPRARWLAGQPGVFLSDVAGARRLHNSPLLRLRAARGIGQQESIAVYADAVSSVFHERVRGPLPRSPGAQVGWASGQLSAAARQLSIWKLNATTAPEALDWPATSQPGGQGQRVHDVLRAVDHRGSDARAAPRPVQVRGNVCGFDPLTADQRDDLLARRPVGTALGHQPAAGAAAAAAGRQWRVSDTGHESFNEVIPDGSMLGDRAVVEGGTGLHLINQESGERVSVQRVKSRDLGGWLAAKFADWPFEGPSTARELMADVAVAGLELHLCPTWWESKSGVNPSGSVAREVRLAFDYLRAMQSHDQLNMQALASVELICRRIIVCQRAVRLNPKAPDFTGLERFVQSNFDESGGLKTTELDKYMAEQQKTSATVLKSLRQDLQEQENERKRQAGRNKGDGKPGK